MEGDPAQTARVKELLHDLVSICRSSAESATVSLLADHVISDSGELLPSLQKLSGQIVPMIQLYQEKRQLLAASPYPQKLIEKIEQLKDSGAHGLDRYLWLVSQVMADPDLKRLVSSERSTAEKQKQLTAEDPVSPTPSITSYEQRITRSLQDQRDSAHGANGVARQLKNLSIPESTQNKPAKPSKDVRKAKPLIEGVSYPATPRWNVDRPYLTGQFIYEKEVAQFSKSLIKGIITERDALSNDGERAIGLFAPSVQELLVIDDLLFAMVGIEGKSIRITKERSRDKFWSFHVDSSMDLSIQELTKRVLPLCENYMTVSNFTESRLQFKHGLVNHAFAAALRAVLQDYHAMVAQLEHQFRLARLSLQGLWFFCQPMMGAMQALATVVKKASVKSLSGAAVLNLLQGQAAAIAGDNSARTLLQKLTQAASAPYFGILERWIHEGVIDDPYGEFFIDENKALQKESLSHDYNATYWQQRYSLKNDVPGFLASAAETILTTGKYLDAIRECGQNARVPFSEDAKLNSGSKRHYLDKINVAYNFASAELLSLIVRKFDLMGRLRSVKHYFLLDQGDFLVHFMDTAKEELVKRPVALSVEKLQSLLELALRTSVAASDPYHEDLTCSLEKSSLILQLHSIMKSGFSKVDSTATESTDPGSMTGLETFTLDYKIRWPLSLVISRKALTKYQLIFRHLFHCKHVERQLSGTWQAHQATRGIGFVGNAIASSYVLCQKMLHFMQSFEHYMTFEVLEPNWHIMDTKLQSAKSIDEVIQLHDFFLDKCLKECILLWPHILKSLEKLKSLCLQYATAIQWLIPSLYTFESPVDTKKIRRCRGQRLQLVKEGEDANFKNTIGQMEEEFRKEMKELLSLLSINSQTEPYLAHLAQGLQGQH